jgi:hypothetical protein
MIFRLIITLLLPLIAVNREIGLVIHHTFVDRYYRENRILQELQPSFDDGLLTCCGFKYGFFGFAVDSNLCQILFGSAGGDWDQRPLRHPTQKNPKGPFLDILCGEIVKARIALPLWPVRPWQTELNYNFATSITK